MKTASNSYTPDSAYAKIIIRLNKCIAVHGYEVIQSHLETIPLQRLKKNGRNIGEFIIHQICKEYGVTRYDLFESRKRLELTEARQLVCVLIEKHLEYTRMEISGYFNRSRHFAKRLIGNFQKILKEKRSANKLLIARYRKLDKLIKEYLAK